MLESNLTTDAILIGGTDGKIKWCNQRATELFDFAPGMPVNRADANATTCLGESVLRRALAGERVEGIEMCVRSERTQNETRWLTVAVDPIFAAGGVDTVIAVFHDITERRQTQQRFRGLMESNILGMALWNRHHAISEANEAFLRILGCTAIESAGLRLEDLAAPGFAEIAAHAFTQVVEGGVCEPFPCEFLTASGARIPVLVAGAALEDGEGLVFALDISERSRLEEKLRQTAKLESLGILAGGIAHDFNNLLTGILGNATLALERTPADSQVAESLRSVVQACERAAALANQILAYSGRGKFQLEPVDLSALVSETLALIETALGRAIRLHLDIAADVPFVEADPSQLQQIVMNLAINAAEAVDNKGEVWVQTGTAELDGTRHPDDIVLGPAAPAGRYVFLNVHDSGPGMGKDTLKRIFDPFFTTKSAGRGLGLAAVLGIVRNHKGVIRVASAPGSGTTFCVYLPVSPAQMREGLDALPRARSAGGVILVIDDELYVRETVRRTLEAADYTVVCAADSIEALRLFQSLGSQIQLAIVDMTMPGEEGQDVVRRLRHYDPALKVIATSGYSESEVKAKFGDLMQAFLAKPYRSDHLCKTVATVIGGGCLV